MLFPVGKTRAARKRKHACAVTCIKFRAEHLEIAHPANVDLLSQAPQLFYEQGRRAVQHKL